MHWFLVLSCLVSAAVSQVRFPIVFPQPYPTRPNPGIPVPQPVHPVPHPGPQVPQPIHPIPQPILPVPQPGGPSTSIVHDTRGGSEYHFSWRLRTAILHTWDSAKQYCERLPGGWAPISIETVAENEWVKTVLTDENQKYIWTSGSTNRHPNFVWGNGQPTGNLDWSHTGSQQLPQPDNAENQIENCLAILNNFYQDGVRWHDVACYHPKPVICERIAQHVF
ncbi:uncharacterized protein LOC143017807 [Oratosquilla oratoria]|uniref:uncharacterized protein LOC143017807 n=1 Tax=Oratosquilla oratoria TaxID=337810 RepID=UPI003F75C6E3